MTAPPTVARSPWRRVRFPLTWCLLLLLVGEVVATVGSPYARTPRAQDVSRIPTNARGWPEYLNPGESPAAWRVAVVGNSQATTRELADERQLFTALLNRRLAADGLPVLVENWSVDGLRSDQIELLMVQARTRGIDLLVLVVSVANLDLERNFRFDRHVADVDLLAGQPRAWPWLEHTTALADLSSHQIGWRWLQLGSALARSRTVVLDLVGQHVPARYHRQLFGRFLLTAPTQAIVAAPASPFPSGASPRSPAPSERTSAMLQQFRRSRLPTVERLVATARRLLVSEGTGFAWVWGPVRPWPDGSVAHAVAPFAGEVCDSLTDVPCLNLAELLPVERFFERRRSSHYDALGHQQVADVLHPLIVDELY